MRLGIQFDYIIKIVVILQSVSRLTKRWEKEQTKSWAPWAWPTQKTASTQMQPQLSTLPLPRRESSVRPRLPAFQRVSEVTRKSFRTCAYVTWPWSLPCLIRATMCARRSSDGTAASDDEYLPITISVRKHHFFCNTCRTIYISEMTKQPIFKALK